MQNRSLKLLRQDLRLARDLERALSKEPHLAATWKEVADQIETEIKSRLS